MPSQKEKVVKSNMEARISKLKNKTTQLENLYRSRNRLDYEIKNLKRSIAKDQKLLKKQSNIMESAALVSRETLLESVEISDDEDPGSSLSEIFQLFKETDTVLTELTELLLKFDEE